MTDEERKLLWRVPLRVLKTFVYVGDILAAQGATSFHQMERLLLAAKRAGRIPKEACISDRSLSGHVRHLDALLQLPLVTHRAHCKGTLTEHGQRLLILIKALLQEVGEPCYLDGQLT